MESKRLHGFVRQHRWKLLIGAVALVLLVWWLGTRGERNAKAPTWLTAPVRQGDLEDVVMATGTLRANRLVNVGAQVSGQVQTLHVQAGEVVHAGQLIAEIDPTQQQAALRDETASIETSRASRSARIANLAQAEANLARQQMMFAEDATSKQELQAAQAAYASAKSDLAVLDAQLRQSSIKLETARTNLGYTRIVAPIDGVVVAVVTEAGQTLNSVQSAPTVVKLASLDPMIVEAQISEADVAKVKPGMPAYFTLLGDSEKRYATKLHSVDPGPSTLAQDTGSNSNPNAIYYNALLKVPNPERVLRIGMTAKVSIITQQARNVLLVPSAALGARDAQGQYAVRVVTRTDKSGKQIITDRKVRVGMNNRVDAVVLEGLKVGDEVVIGQDGGNKMPDSMVIVGE